MLQRWGGLELLLQGGVGGVRAEVGADLFIGLFCSGFLFICRPGKLQT
jgi:hypothetical protein